MVQYRAKIEENLASKKRIRFVLVYLFLARIIDLYHSNKIQSNESQTKRTWYVTFVGYLYPTVESLCTNFASKSDAV